jgi:hypothetical protein
VSTYEELEKVVTKERNGLAERQEPCVQEIISRLVGHTFQVPTISGMMDAKIVAFGEKGVDVVFRDGAHLEIEIRRTGWGVPVGMKPEEGWFEKVGAPRQET